MFVMVNYFSLHKYIIIMFRLINTVICQPPFCLLYVISMTNSRLPADGTGKPLSRTARRTLQLVNPTFGSEVIGILRIQGILVLWQSPSIKDLGFME